MTSTERKLPSLGETYSTLAGFAKASGCSRLSVVIDQGGEVADAVAVYDPADQSLEINEGDEQRHIPFDENLAATTPIGEVHVHVMPPFSVDLELGEITGALGGLEHLARALISLADLFGGSSVAIGSFTTDSGTELELGARSDGEVGIHCGGVDFETPPQWPPG